jgi:hypothetical protein
MKNKLITSKEFEERDISANTFSDENKDVFENEARIVRMEGKLNGVNSIDALIEVLAIEFELGNNEKGLDSDDFYSKNGNEFGIFLDGRNANDMDNALKYIYPQESEEYSVFKLQDDSTIKEYNFRSLRYKDRCTERDAFFKRIMDDDITWGEFDAVVEEMKNLEAGYYDSTGNLIITLKEYHDLFICEPAYPTRVAARFTIPKFKQLAGIELTFAF